MQYFFIFIFFQILILSCKDSRVSIKPSKRNLVFAVFASGKINPKHIYNVVPKVSGYVSKLLVDVGDFVKAGQPLITIRSETNEKNLEVAKNQFILAQKNLSPQSPLLNGARQDVESARLRFQSDSLNFERYRSLMQKKVVAPQQYDQAQTQFEISKRNYEKSRHSLKQIENQVQTEYRNAQLLLESQQSSLSEFTIFSAIDGKVYDLIAKEGELVSMNSPLLVIGDIRYFEAELYIDERDINFIKPEQKVVYEIDAFKGKFFEGQTLKIYQKVNPSNKTCKIIASIQPGEFNFLAGLSLEANIIIEEKKDVIVLPKSFLIENEKVIRKEKKDTVKIIKGIEDLEYVEVIAGIDEKTEILKP
jgi:multidrug efflux pump subunit AcrA (membrane-fusion protein)